MKKFHKRSSFLITFASNAQKKDNDEVADLFQEILINLWKGSGAFRGDASLNSWIWKVSLNTCISYERKRRLHTEPLDMDIDLFEDNDEQTRQAALLRERISKLGLFDRAILLEEFTPEVRAHIYSIQFHISLFWNNIPFSRLRTRTSMPPAVRT